MFIVPMLSICRLRWADFTKVDLRYKKTVSNDTVFL